MHLDERDHPGDPFILFNLGSVYSEWGDHRSALAALQRSLAGSHPRDSIVRKLYAPIAQCHLRPGNRNDSLTTLAEGRRHYPEDAELLFLSANLLREWDRPAEAEALYRQLIGGMEPDHFASVDSGLRAVKGRHNLAVLLMEAGRLAEAEALWRAALASDPQFLGALTGLTELYQRTGNAAGAATQFAALRGVGPDGAAEAAALEGRQLLNRRDYAGAAALLEVAGREYPNAVSVRVTLSHLRMNDGSPNAVIEAALRDVLRLDPGNDQARRNLEGCLQNSGRSVNGMIDEPPIPPA